MKTLKKFLQIFIIAFLINLPWEVSHSLLYDWSIPPLQNTVQYYVPRILQATLGDGFYIALIFLIVTLINKKLFWVSKPSRKHYIQISILGILVAIFVEIKAEFFNYWTYNSLMPTIFGIGITPLIQLAITGSLTLYILSKNSNKPA
jgi:hypothetical protein